ncbi:hypothetical protein AMTRI_Chr05g56950 [Amborella trichopoda]
MNYIGAHDKWLSPVIVTCHQWLTQV